MSSIDISSLRNLIFSINIENKICVDCNLIDRTIQYISVNNGVLLCSLCGIKHINMKNKRISYIRSLYDKWDEYLLLFIIRGGNQRYKEFISEYNLEEKIMNIYSTKALFYYRKLVKSEILGDEPPIKIPIEIGMEAEEGKEGNSNKPNSNTDFDLDLIYEPNKESYNLSEDYKLTLKNKIIISFLNSKQYFDSYLPLLKTFSYNTFVGFYSKLSEIKDKLLCLNGNNTTDNNIYSIINYDNKNVLCLNNEFYVEIKDSSIDSSSVGSSIYIYDYFSSSIDIKYNTQSKVSLPSENNFIKVNFDSIIEDEERSVVEVEVEVEKEEKEKEEENLLDS